VYFSSAAFSSQPIGTVGFSLRGREWLDVPDHLCVLVDAPIAGEEAHPSDAGDALCDPFLLVLIRLIDELLRLTITVEVVRDEVVVAMLNNPIHESREVIGIAKGALLDGVEDVAEGFIKLVSPIHVSVTEILHVLRQIAEEEDVVLANFSRDFNLVPRLVTMTFSRCG
jgi:hypothetical protein